MQLSSINNPLITEIINRLDDPKLTTAEWTEIHSKCVAAKYLGTKLLKHSRDAGINRFGMEFVADTEVQLEMSLGLSAPEERPELNPDDKSVALVTLESTYTSFLTWKRKMGTKIEAWSPEQKKRAVSLLKPMAELYQALQ
jgi:hypothetical protein